MASWVTLCATHLLLAACSGAQLVVVGQDCVEAEEAARSAAATHLPPLTYVSPYNDWMVSTGFDQAFDMPSLRSLAPGGM
jgi:hypothetical protein